MKMIRLNYCKTHWTDDYKQLIIDEKDKSILVNIDLIAAVSPDEVRGYETDSSGRIFIRHLYYVRTAVPVGRGLNGVDYLSYYVTEETYKKIIENIECVNIDVAS